MRMNVSGLFISQRTATNPNNLINVFTYMRIDINAISPILQPTKTIVL